VKIASYTLHPHSVCVHFSIALYPTALFFLVLSFFYSPQFSQFTYFHLMILAVVSSSVSHATGVCEWKQKYRGYRTRIFTRKIQYSYFVEALGLLCTLWFGVNPDIVQNGGVPLIVFLVCNISILPLLVFLGYLGGRLVFGGAH
jgi:uncharacterized membrane protein